MKHNEAQKRKIGGLRTGGEIALFQERLRSKSHSASCQVTREKEESIGGANTWGKVLRVRFSRTVFNDAITGANER